MKRFKRLKIRNKERFVYLECRLQQDKPGYCIYKLKCQKMVARTYLETSKQERKYR